MHLASRFLVAAIEHASRDAVGAFFEEVEGLIGRQGYGFRPDADIDLSGPESFGGGALAAPRARVGANLPLDEEAHRRRILAFVEASVRLAALFHDLGHLPFSHDFETALREHVGQHAAAMSEGLRDLVAESPHEEIGHKLAALVFESLLGGVTPAVRASYGLAQQILDNEPPYYASRRPRAGVLAWLHSLVDGEIDSDRADYLLRDGRALGFEFAGYDLDRLVDNLVVVRDAGFGFITAVNEPGMSAVESFFLSRARSNQAMVRHHKVSQLGAALQHATVAALATEGGADLLRSLDKLATNKVGAKDAGAFLEEYSRYDDGWWIEVLRKVDAKGDPLLAASLRAALSRQPTLRSLWKRKGDLAPEELQLLNDISSADRANAAAQLKKAGVLLLAHRFTPYRCWPQGGGQDSIIQVRTDSRGLRPAAEHSLLMRGLIEATSSDPHVFAFAPQGGDAVAKQREQVLGVLKAVGAPPREPRREPKARPRAGRRRPGPRGRG